MPIPDKIKNKPELLPGLEMYFHAFNRLCTCRAVGMGIGPIPWTAVREYAAVYEFDAEHTDALFDAVDAMDNAYLTWANKKPDKDDKAD